MAADINILPILEPSNVAVLESNVTCDPDLIFNVSFLNSRLALLAAIEPPNDIFPASRSISDPAVAVTTLDCILPVDIELPDILVPCIGTPTPS